MAFLVVECLRPFLPSGRRFSSLALAPSVSHLAMCFRSVLNNWASQKMFGHLLKLNSMYMFITKSVIHIYTSIYMRWQSTACHYHVLPYLLCRLSDCLSLDTHTQVYRQIIYVHIYRHIHTHTLYIYI